MIWGWLLGAALALIILGLLIYWQLVIAEGTYLGTKVVTLLYDWTAHRYNAIKEFDSTDEDESLGRPLTACLATGPDVVVIDVATGTGRLPQTMFRQSGFNGRVIGVDRSARMLAVAREDTISYRRQLHLVQADAMALPFANNCAQAVSCLEALEFLPDPDTGLAELVRVVQGATPADYSRGWLLTTNRIGWEARFMPGKTRTRTQLKSRLQQLQLTHIAIHVWQDIYDLVWAQKQHRYQKDNL
jgi:ubiquinone/menaquinone biosynthesis C-methylase UbiE